MYAVILVRGADLITVVKPIINKTDVLLTGLLFD